MEIQNNPIQVDITKNSKYLFLKKYLENLLKFIRDKISLEGVSQMKIVIMKITNFPTKAWKFKRFLTINKNNVSNLAKTMIFYKIIKQTNKTIKIN